MSDIFKYSKIQKIFISILTILLFSIPSYGQDDEHEYIDEDMCIECHDESEHGVDFEIQIGNSIHEGFGCLECHTDKNTLPHIEDSEFNPGCEGCAVCHEAEDEEYEGHGRLTTGECEEIPKCSDCHGGHDILPSTDRDSRVSPVNLSQTCGACHEDTELTQKHQILINHPVDRYKKSVHGMAVEGGISAAATCTDCHSTAGTSHKIFAAGFPQSTINHFNVPKTCGECHEEVERDYWEGIHGQLTARGETDSPVCTQCHGEHSILSPSDPRSPVSKSRMAEAVCAPCHDSAALNEKYGLETGRLISFIDSYHGLKSKSGDTHVANCASCHGMHRILPSSDSTSTVHHDNLQATCGECHPGISEKLATTPIHGIANGGLRTPIANIVEKIYILAIIVIIGLMIIHWIIDLIRQIVNSMRKPQVRRMRTHEVWQHTFLMLSFMILAISGFALRFHNSWISSLFFGWEGGFAIRGLVHRIAAVIFIASVIWHAVFLIFFPRGRAFVRDMLPQLLDFKQFYQRIMYNLGRTDSTPQFKRFSYIEKAEYWALVWGTVVMIITGIFLWFDNYFSIFVPKGFLDVSLVVHYWEAWLATLAILIWHLYSTIFNPHVYPMNTSWLSGKMPEEMYEREHPQHLEEAKKEEKDILKKEMDSLSISKKDLEDN
jgi:cytochrome b subunit of formate dehydrogenase